jgi:hypothetical protein
LEFSLNENNEERKLEYCFKILKSKQAEVVEKRTINEFLADVYKSINEDNKKNLPVSLNSIEKCTLKINKEWSSSNNYVSKFQFLKESKKNIQNITLDETYLI